MHFLVCCIEIAKSSPHVSRSFCDLVGVHTTRRSVGREKPCLQCFDKVGSSILCLTLSAYNLDGVIVIKDEVLMVKFRSSCETLTEIRD